ncbi:MAG: Tryptophan synthase alpha chain [Labilithrix sp.]|nr:Tryptophan synthase alpha chain [Labilithrix sp.]
MKSWHLGVAFIIALGTTVLPSCGSDKRNGFDQPPGATSGGPGNVDPFGQLEAGSPEGGTPPVIGHLQGRVVAPEGTVPISQAMVYLTTRTPDPIPGNAYCDTCVRLTAFEPYAYTKSDGTFDLAAYATGKQYLVVQKGQFRRIREVDVVKGDQPIAGDLTRLPGKTDATTGDTVPKIAVVNGGYDKIDFSMKKLGIEEFYRYGDGPVGLPGSDGPGTKTGKTGNQLMNSAPEMSGYHIVLLPCAAMGYSHDDTNGVFLCGGPTGVQKTAFQSYVESGGKLYVTDFAYEAVRQTWPGFITFYDATMHPLTNTSQGIGTACRGGAETTEGKAQDKGLGDWMTAIGHADIELKASWSRIESVHPQPGYGPDGKPKTITPKVWMTSNIAGSQLPATVSFEQKCGRVLFSTYHAEGDDGSNLLAQEKALLYVLLEVGVCVGELPPPPPPR